MFPINGHQYQSLTSFNGKGQSAFTDKPVGHLLSFPAWILLVVELLSVLHKLQLFFGQK